MEALSERIRIKQFEWKDAEARAFQRIKDAYRENQILILWNPDKQAWVHADASNYAIGSVISQWMTKDEGDRFYSIPESYYPRK
jgi:hypothetical protein